MKNKRRLFVILCIAAVMLWGCSTNRRPMLRYVTQVDIACDHKGIPIRRHYTDSKKMEAVLIYLRLLHPGGAPSTNPETVEADLYEITVSLSDGQKRIYHQKDHRFFRKPASGWQAISPERSYGLYTLMRNYQSDL